MSWTKSTKCEFGSCVEVSFNGEWVGVRNSQLPLEEAWFTHAEWDAFLAGVKEGEFDSAIKAG